MLIPYVIHTMHQYRNIHSLAQTVLRQEINTNKRLPLNIFVLFRLFLLFFFLFIHHRQDGNRESITIITTTAWEKNLFLFIRVFTG